MLTIPALVKAAYTNNTYTYIYSYEQYFYLQ